VSDPFRLVKEADVVCVDVVGTLLVRGVCRPVDVYRLTQEWFNAHSGSYLTDELAPHRLAAESDLLDEAERSGPGAGPVTLGAIYERVGRSMRLDAGMTAALVESELEAERRLLRANPELVELYHFALEQGTQIVGVGDTCLPGRLLVEVLDRQGLAPLGDLVISSDTGTSLAADRAWDELGRRFPDRRLVHVGTDPRVAEAAGRHGVATHLVTSALDAYRHRLGPAAALDGPRVFRHLEIDGFRLKNLHRSMLNALVAKRLAGDDSLSVPYVVGYGALGPFLTGFVQWLHRAASQRGCDGLWFVERDGPFLSGAYRRWWGDSALPLRAVSAGAEEPPDPSDLPGVVSSGWSEETGRWDGGGHHARGDRDVAVRLCAGVGPAGPPPAGRPPTDAFVDGRLDAQRSLFGDVFGTARGFLEACVGGGAGEQAAPGRLDEVRRAALDFVADFAEVTEGLPSTVAVVDRRTACENLVMVLNFPSPSAGHLLDQLAPTDRSDPRAG
jgi:hypothetical protein